jgi:ubiquinone/menaquinone biosynthesis C-methylase UbiE
MTQSNQTSECDPSIWAEKLFRIVSNSWMSQATYIAAELRLADLLADGPKDADDLARSTGYDAAALRRLMRALASLDLCIQLDDGSFQLRPMGSLLCAEAPNSLRSWTIWWGRHLRPAWGNLPQRLKAGEKHGNVGAGAPDPGYLGCDTETAVAFNQAMADLTRLVSRQVMRVYDFAGMNRIVDVGGGSGQLVATILEAHPQLRATLFDLPGAIKDARTHLKQAGLVARCKLVAGSFFESVPVGGDAYLLKSILHNWDDERSTVILQHCRRAMPRDAKLLLIERIMPTRMQPSPHHRALAWSDLNMLVLLEGRERTEPEFRTLLASSGFNTGRILPVGLQFSLIECLPC